MSNLQILKYWALLKCMLIFLQNKLISIIPYELQVLNVTIISREKCEYIYNRSMKNNICTLNKKIEGVCMVKIYYILFKYFK